MLANCSFGIFSSTTVLNFVYTDSVVTPSGEEMSSRLAPGERLASKCLLGIALVWLHRGSSDIILDELVWWKIEDLDSLLGCNDEPIKLLGEEHAVYWGVAVTLSEPLSVDNVPDHDHAIAGSRCEVCRVFDNVKSGNLSLVTSEGVHEGHIEIVPHLDSLVPGGGDADGWLLSVVESDTGHCVFML